MGFSRSYDCATQYKFGGFGQYGAWGNFIDGCTVKLTCPVNTGLMDVQRCDVGANSFIDNYYYRGERLTMNARTRRFETGGHVYGWRDGSCDSAEPLRGQRQLGHRPRTVGVRPVQRRPCGDGGQLGEGPLRREAELPRPRPHQPTGSRRVHRLGAVPAS